VFEDLIRGNFIATPGATMRRSSLDAVGPYDERLSVEDWDMWLRLAARYPFSYSEPAVGTYRIHDGGYWRQLVREQTARQPLFFSLIKAYGVRDGTDPVIMARLEELVGDMVADGDPKAADFERWLAEIRTTYERDQLERQTRAPVNRSDDRESEQQVGPGPAVAGRDPAEMHRAARQIAAGSSVGRARGTEGVLQPSPSGILYIAPWMTTGGSDQATLEWFRQIDHSTFRRYLVTTLASDNALFDACASVADEAWCLPELIRREAVPQFLVDFIAARGIDVIHIMNSKFGVDLIPAIKAAYPDVPIVVQFHMDDADLSGTGYPRYVASRYDAQVDAYSVISQDMANRLRAHGVTPGKIEVIYLGVDATGRFDPNRSDGVAVDLAPGRFHVLVPARLVEVKRPELAIDIAEKLAHRVPEAQCHFVGDGPLRQSLERTCSERNLGDLVRFHGASTNMWGWYASCQASLLCSISEGIPMVLYESMSMGLPMVAPLLGGIGELLDEDTGAPLPVGAGIDAYVDALVTLAEDPDRRLRLGAEARRRVLEGFKVEDMGDRHRELYGRLIAGARVPS
jgi:glycosyltransferase involved in cell wall biosynthesis